MRRRLTICYASRSVRSWSKEITGHLLVAKKIFFLIRDIDGPAMTAASSIRGPEGFPGVAGSYMQSPHARTDTSTGPQPAGGPEAKSPRFGIQSSLGSPLRSRGPPDQLLRHEPIYIPKK